ncbi:MAG: T9SS type A sorting domain-containing protein [Bacteroidia bacterium]
MIKQLLAFIIIILCSTFLHAQITIIKPSMGDKLNACSIASIVWTQDYTTDAVLDYSVDGGINWTNITTTYAGPDTNRYEWFVPNMVSSNVSIRISKYNEAQIKDSTKLFTIVADTNLAITYPKGGESFAPGALCTILWNTTGVIPKVSLFYSINDGLTWETLDVSWLSLNIDNNGFYRWIIPATLPIASKCKIKIINSDKECEVAESFINISNNPSISIINPQRNEIWYVSKTHLLKWSSYNLPSPNVNIDLSFDNGKNWQMVDSNYYSASDTRYVLTPNNITDQAMIRVSATNDTSIKDFVNLKIHICSATVLNIVDGENLTACTTKKIIWTQKGFDGVVYIDYSIDGGKKWSYVDNGYSTNDTGTYYWLVPITPSTQTRIRIRDGGLIDIEAVSPINFTITTDSVEMINITSPKGGESFSVNSVQSVEWNTKGNIGNVSIQFSTDGGLYWYYLRDLNFKESFNLSNTGSFNWVIPQNLDPSSNCLIKIYDFSNNCLIGYLKTPFSVHNNSNIQILNPTINEVLYTGRPYDIKWLDSYTTDYANIDYSLDNGLTWTKIDSNYYYFNTHPWIVPNKVINQGIMRVSSTADTSIHDQVPFKIEIPTIKLTSLTGGETLTGCDQTTITWTEGGTAPSAYLDYSFDEGNTWICFAKAPQQLGANSYDWLIPSIASTNVRIRIRDDEQGIIKDSSKSNITILSSTKQKSLTLTTFNSIDSISLSSLTPIRWSTVGNVSNVSLQYSIDGGLNWDWVKDVYGFKADSIPNKGIYYWYVPAGSLTSTRGMIKIYEHNEPCIMDYNDALFKINKNASIAIIHPYPDTTYYVGRDYNVEWATANLPSPFVNVEYSINNGTNWVMLDSNVSSTSFYKWTIPKIITTQGKLKVSATANPIIKHIINFKTENSTVTLLAPVGGEVFKGCNLTSISWIKKGGSYGSYVDYSLDGGINWMLYGHFNELDGDTNTSMFIIPNLSSDHVRIRMRDDKYADINDATKTDLTIIANDVITLTLTYPNGGESFSAGSLKKISWITKGNVPYVSLLYSLDGGLTWDVLETRGGTADYIYNTGSFDWLVPATLPLSSNCLIKIVERRGHCIIDYTDTFFSIDHDPVVAITNPTEGDTTYVGKTYPIEWSKAHLKSEYVAVEYSVNNGISWTLIDSNATNAYNWVIPNKVTNQGIIRARASLDNATISLVNFKIANTVITQLISEDVAPSWKVYPNPTTDVINLNHVSLKSENFSIDLINAKGQTVYKTSLKNYSGAYSKQIDMSSETKGIYLLRITTAEKIITKKIIKN